MIKVGLIGCGGMGNVHAECYNAMGENVKLAAVADLVSEKREQAAKKYGCDTYESGEELIQNADVDMVDICLPTYLHTPHALMAMNKGLHVFVEKPVCLNEEEATLLLETEKQTGVKVQVGQVIRFWDEYKWLKAAVNTKQYGELISGVFTRLSPNPKWSWENWYNNPEKSGSMALDLHVHDVDFIRYILGEPKKVTSNATRNAEGVLQQIFTTYQYEKAIVTAEGCWDYPENFPFAMAYRVKFEKATAIYDSTATPSLVVYKQEDGKIIPELQKDFEQDVDMGLNVSSLGAYYNELKYFTDRLQNDEQPEIAPLSEAIASARLAWSEIKTAGGVKQ